MIAGIWAAIKGLGVFLGILDRSQALKNTPEMIKRDQARKENEATDKEAKEIKNKDENALRTGLS